MRTRDRLCQAEVDIKFLEDRVRELESKEYRKEFPPKYGIRQEVDMSDCRHGIIVGCKLHPPKSCGDKQVVYHWTYVYRIFCNDNELRYYDEDNIERVRVMIGKKK